MTEYIFNPEKVAKEVEHRKFDLDLVEPLNLTINSTGGKRRYAIPAPDQENSEYVLFYPSVTTVIGNYYDKEWLKEWKTRVGNKEAMWVTGSAATKGKNIHNMAEAYLYNREYWNGQLSINVSEFNKVVPVLNEHVTKVLGSELPLYSHKLRTAGTTDLVCYWDDVPTIVDFKTSRRYKREEEIEHYFVQCTAYAIMFEEIYGLTIEKFIVIMLVEWEDEPTLYEGNPKDYYDLVEKIFNVEGN